MIKKNSKKVIKSVYTGFRENQIQLNSATLTYYTLLSLVPIVALLLMIAERFQLSSLVKDRIASLFVEQPQIGNYLFSFAQNTLQEIDSAAFKVISLLFLIWSAIQLLFYIDIGINQLWHKPPQPNFIRRVLRFITMVLICPLLFISVSGATLYATVGVNYLLMQGGVVHAFFRFILFITNLLPSLFAFCVLSFLYYFVPYKKVKMKHAVVAGFFTAIVYEAVQYGYVALQIGVASYSAIYGTFAALPLFLVWVNLSWTIFLTGAKFCYSLSSPHT